MKKITQIHTYVTRQTQYSESEKFYVIIMTIREEVDYETASDISKLCKLLNVSEEFINNSMLNHNGNLWFNMPIFENKQDAEGFLEDLEPYIIMIKLTI